MLAYLSEYVALCIGLSTTRRRNCIRGKTKIVNEEAINKIEIKEDETHYQLLNFIKASFAYESEIMAIITERKDPMDTIKTLEKLSTAIFLMKAYVMGRNGA